MLIIFWGHKQITDRSRHLTIKKNKGFLFFHTGELQFMSLANSLNGVDIAKKGIAKNEINKILIIKTFFQ